MLETEAQRWKATQLESGQARVWTESGHAACEGQVSRLWTHESEESLGLHGSTKPVQSQLQAQLKPPLQFCLLLEVSLSCPGTGPLVFTVVSEFLFFLQMRARGREGYSVQDAVVNAGVCWFLYHTVHSPC